VRQAPRWRSTDARADKNALLTGVGRGSIGVEILRGLLSGGARVVVTTSRYSRAVVEQYQAIYQECGSRGSSLTVVPFNGGSKQDVEALIEYIYSTDPHNGLGMDLDYILPFAALPENGREIDGIDDKSELAHRIMLTNLLRLLGAVKAKKASRRFITRPTQVILPLSPNHGLFGNDGLYSESKIVRGAAGRDRADRDSRSRRSSIAGRPSRGARTSASPAPSSAGPAAPVSCRRACANDEDDAELAAPTRSPRASSRRAAARSAPRRWPSTSSASCTRSSST